VIKIHIFLLVPFITQRYNVDKRKSEWTVVVSGKQHVRKALPERNQNFCKIALSDFFHSAIMSNVP
jgi:hypothetical protein